MCLCVIVLAPSLECDSRGSGLHIKISAAVIMHLSSSGFGHSVLSNGGDAAERKDDYGGMHRRTFTCDTP